MTKETVVSTEESITTNGVSIKFADGSVEKFTSKDGFVGYSFLGGGAMLCVRISLKTKDKKILFPIASIVSVAVDEVVRVTKKSHGDVQISLVDQESAMDEFDKAIGVDVGGESADPKKE